jgi:hypothetical protein
MDVEGDSCWMDVDEQDDVIEKAPTARFKISDRVQATHLLSDDSINKVILGDHCVKGRKCMSCPNDRECADLFGSVKEAKETIRNFHNEPGNIYMRRKQLLQDIDAMKVLKKESTQVRIQYKIDGRFVCKSFFHVSTPVHMNLSLLIFLFAFSVCVRHKCSNVSRCSRTHSTEEDFEGYG